MKSAADYKPSLAFGLLLMGKPKKGKSILSCQFPGVGMVDCDNNMGGPVRWLREHKPEKLKDIWIYTTNINTEDEPITIPNVPGSGTVTVAPGKEVPEAARYANVIRGVNLFLASPSIKTICLDGLSSIAQYLMDHIVASKSAGKKEGMTISDWIPFREMLSKLVINTRAKNRLVIMTCHEEVNKDELSGALEWQPNVPSKLAGNLGGFFSDVWRCESEQVGDTIQYKVRCAPRGTVPSLGNSLGLPLEFTFTWEGFAKFLVKGESTKNTPKP